MQERREHIRIKYRNAVMVKIREVSGHPELANTVYMGSTEDVSETGVRIRIRTELPINTNMFLCIVVLDPEGLFTMQGRVQWCSTLEDEETDPYLLGIEFVKEYHKSSSWLHMVNRLKKEHPQADNG